MSGSKPSHGALRVSRCETSGQKIARLELETAWLRDRNARLVERISALGASSWPEQPQQRPAAVERRSEEASGGASNPEPEGQDGP